MLAARQSDEIIRHKLRTTAPQQSSGFLRPWSAHLFHVALRIEAKSLAAIQRFAAVRRRVAKVRCPQ